MKRAKLTGIAILLLGIACIVTSFSAAHSTFNLTPLSDHPIFLAIVGSCITYYGVRSLFVRESAIRTTTYSVVVVFFIVIMFFAWLSYKFFNGMS